MNSRIIELSRLNGTKDDDNKAVWKNNMPQAVTINPGDQITLKNAFINVDEQQSTDIVIPPQGQDISLTFGYYEYNYDVTNKTALANGSLTADYKPYIIYQDGNDVGDLQSVTLYLSDEVNGVDNVPFKLQYQKKDGSTATASFPMSYHGNVSQNVVFPATASGVTGAVVGSVKWINPSDYPFYDTEDGQVITFVQFNYSNVTPIGHKHLKQGTVQVRLEPGTYDQPSIAKHITDKLQYLDPSITSEKTVLTPANEFLIRARSTGGADGQILHSILIGQEDMTNGYNLGTTSPEWVGASQTSITYGSDAGLGDLFAIEFLHSPFFNNKQISVMMAKDTGGKFQIVPQSTGIFLTDVQPRTFWEQELGFDISSILINLTQGLS